MKIASERMAKIKETATNLQIGKPSPEENSNSHSIVYYNKRYYNILQYTLLLESHGRAHRMQG
jgi:hypothetical protein